MKSVPISLPFGVWMTCAASVLGGCMSQSLEDDPRGAAVQASSENPQQQYIYRLYATDPERAAVSYAVGSLINCSGTFIGPNTFMTAAHCGGAVAFPNGNGFTTIPTSIQFTTTRNLGAPNGSNAIVQDNETWTNCRWVTHAFRDSDLLLIHCPNSLSAGVGPGDKYGYVDFEMAESALSLGAPLYSVHADRNALPATPTAPSAGPGMRYFAPGVVQMVNDNFNVGTDNSLSLSPGSPYRGVRTNVWSYSGSSGSAQFSSATHRILVGPTSIGYNEAAFRQAFSMRDYALYARTFAPGAAPPNTLDCVNNTYLSGLGLLVDHTNASRDPNYYRGVRLDQTGDGVFDVQQDIEWTAGENRREVYNLAFNSPRRNGLWTKSPYTWAQFNTSDPANYSARIINFTNTTQDTLAHTRLNLLAGTFRITLRYRTQSLVVGSSMVLGLRGPSGTYYTSSVPLVVSGTDSQITVRVTTPEAGAALVLRMTNVVDMEVKDLVVVTEGATLNFDTFDKREHWRNYDLNRRAVITPDGRAPDNTPNWAARVIYNPAYAYGGYPVTNSQLAFASGMNHRVCFWHRAATAASASGYVYVNSGGWQWFDPGANWAQSCFNTGVVPASGATMFFGFWSASNQNSYLVDDVTITPL